MNTKTSIYAISISAQAILDMHSLNNEGGEGNQIQTRMVTVLGADEKLHSVNAISGDMFKHIQSEHLHRLATAEGLPLSVGAHQLNANRINYDIKNNKNVLDALTKAKSNAGELDYVLQTCAITDMAGVLITEGKRSLPRKSVVEFGWVVGIPGQVETDTFFHVKYEAERGGDSASVDNSGSISGKQTPFHRPASSGAYAIVLNIEASRVGFNDISQKYAVSEADRQKRLRILLESVLHTFISPEGAMRSTQNPHIVGLKGVITISRDVVPAPCVSPLKSNFAEDVKRISTALNTLRPNAIEVFAFDSVGEFTEKLASLIHTASPMNLPVAN